MWICVHILHAHQQFTVTFSMFKNIHNYKEKQQQLYFPNSDPSSREQSFQEFQRAAGFPGVLGVLDYVQVDNIVFHL